MMGTVDAPGLEMAQEVQPETIRMQVEEQERVQAMCYLQL